MTPNDIPTVVAMHEVKIQKIEERLDRLEDTQVQINKIAISIKELAMSVKQLCERQDKQESRVLALEGASADKWNTLTKTVISCVASGIVGLVIGAIVKML